MSHGSGSTGEGANTAAGDSPRRWTFGPAVLDESAMTLAVNGEPVGVERKSLEVLRYLLRHAGKLVTKDDLLGAVWPGRVVSETVLTKAIHKLREALGKHGAEIVATVHGYGYRLDGSVEFENMGETHSAVERTPEPGPAPVEAAAPHPMPAPAPSPAAPGPAVSGPVYRRRWAMPIGIGLALLVLAAAFFLLRTQPVEAVGKSVAVLPFTNMSADEGNAWFTDGMQDEILTHLARIKDLKVISRTSVEKYRGGKHDLRTIARELDVATVVEGAVQRVGNRVRINVQLIDAGNDAHLWADSYDRDVSDVFAVQTDIARSVARSLRAALLPAEAKAVAAIPTNNPKAYDLYLQANALDRKLSIDFTWSEEDSRRAESLCEQAIAEDPTFALAHAKLADILLSRSWYGPGVGNTTEHFAAVRKAIDRALELDPGLGEARRILGIYYSSGIGDFPSAVREYELALQALPNHAELLSNYGVVLRRLGRFEESLAAHKKAASLNPQMGALWGTVAQTLSAMRRYDESVEYYERTISLSNHVLYVSNLAWDRMQRSGDPSHLRHAAEQLLHSAPQFAGEATVFGLSFAGFLRDSRLTERFLARVQGDWVSGFQTHEPASLLRANAYLFLGDRGRARPLFEQAILDLRTHYREGLESDNPFVSYYPVFQLGWSLAAAGHREEARAQAQRSAELRRNWNNAFDGVRLLSYEAQIHGLNGDLDLAFEALAEADRSAVGGLVFGPGSLRLDPAWDPLRGDPRFKALLDKYPVSQAPESK